MHIRARSPHERRERHEQGVERIVHGRDQACIRAGREDRVDDLSWAGGMAEWREGQDQLGEARWVRRVGEGMGLRRRGRLWRGREGRPCLSDRG